MRFRIALLAAVLATARPCAATVWHVLPDGSGDAPTIAAALAAAAPGDTVEAACGTYYEHDVELKGGVVLKSVDGDPACVTIHAMQQGPVLHCLTQAPPPRVIGITIAGGVGATGVEAGGGGLHCVRSDPVLTDCRFAGNVSEFGGGMACYRSAPFLERCTFTSNAASAGSWAAGGAIFSDDSSPSLRDCSFDRNRAFAVQQPGDGGGVFTQKSALTATNCSFRENSSGAGGGGFYSFDGDVSTLTACTFEGNFSQAGGAAYLEASFAQIIDGSFTGNTADNGGALFVAAYSVPLLKGCSFTANGAAPHSGGAIDCWQSTLSVEDCVFRDNTAALDGGAFVANGVSQVVFDGCRFLSNTAGRNGGALCGTYATSIDFLGSTLHANGASASGGALYLWQSGPVRLERTIVAASVGIVAVACVNTGPVTAECVDLHANGGGNWVGCLSSFGGVPGNLSEDPLFCGADAGDVTLMSTSPCLPANNACGVLIGAHPQGCLDPTSAGTPWESVSWGALKGRYRAGE